MKKGWFHHTLSIDEMKSSSLVIVFILFSIIGTYILFRKGDLPPNLTTFLLAMAGIIGGVNAFNFMSNNIGMSRNGQMPNQSYPYNYSNYNSNMYNQNYNQPIQQPINNAQPNPTNMTQQPHKI